MRITKLAVALGRDGAVTLVMLIVALATAPVVRGQTNWHAITEATHRDARGNAMRVWYGAEENGGTLPSYSGTLDRPFIIVEGFDSNNGKHGSWYYAQETYFFDEARKARADILILDFADATADMVDNAEVVQSAVRYISSIKAGSISIRLGGISMGGVLARYALAEAEESGDPLDVSHFVSLDSPHQGAAIDRELLYWIYDPPRRIPESKLRNFRALLKSEAAKQMLVYNPYSSGEHDALYQKIRTVNGDGYPKKTKNIGVAFSGRWDAPDHGEWLAIEATWLIDIERFHITSGEAIAEPGSILPDEFTDESFWVWAIFNVDLERPRDPTFIPYASALDIVGGNSQFDVRLAS